MLLIYLEALGINEALKAAFESSFNFILYFFKVNLLSVSVGLDIICKR